MFFIALLISNVLIQYVSSTIVLNPIHKPLFDDSEVGLIFVQAAQVDPSNYKNISYLLQQKFPSKLWISLVEFPANIPTADLIAKQIDASFAALAQQGFKITPNTPFFFSGHGIGAILIQDYVLNNFKTLSTKCKPQGLILEAGYVQRKNYNIQKGVNNILAISGELDGLNRISRMAESLYFGNSLQNQLTLIVNGMNHYQFSGEGIPPTTIVQNDIDPEIDNSQARDQVTSILVAFMKISLGIQTDDDKRVISAFTDSTAELLNPLINAFLMDGHYALNPPCYLDKRPNCTIGCPWSEHSQAVMGSNSNATVIGSDTFFKASQVFPDPLPAIHNKCDKTKDCVLNVTTISELVYGDTDTKADESFDPVTASEIKTKLMSRQSILLAATGQKLDFKITDGDDRCAMINNESLKWALTNLPTTTLRRYLEKGKKLVMGSDIDMSNDGPLWIWDSLVNIYFLLKILNSL
jgi:hypothetical protein